MENYPLAPMRESPPCGERIPFHGDTPGAGEELELRGAVTGHEPGLTPGEYSIDESTHYDLALGIMVLEDIEFRFTYNGEKLTEDAVEALATHYLTLLAEMEANPDGLVVSLEVTSETEKRKLVAEFNDTASEYPCEKSLHDLFSDSAAAFTGNTALISASNPDGQNDGTVPVSMEPTAVTYGQLDEITSNLAHELFRHGVRPGDIVAVALLRSMPMVTAIFGILKAGAAYLPMDPAYPVERVEYILNDSGAKVFLVSSDISPEALPSSVRGSFNDSVSQCKSPEDILSGTIFANSIAVLNCRSSFSSNVELNKSDTDAGLAYIIYTSGSTGKPKGVAVRHGSVVNLLYALQAEYPLLAGDTYVFKTSYTFDVSVTELFGWFLGGGRLAVLEANGEKDPRVILDTVETTAVTHINFVPSMFNVFVDELDSVNISRLSSLKYIFLAGEALLPELVEKFARLGTGIRLENLYGPTEATVYATKYSLSDWKGVGGIPIGFPMRNMGILILDSHGRLQPVGVPGELCISGPGVAEGYLNNPLLTVRKFEVDCLRRLSEGQGGAPLGSPFCPSGSAGTVRCLYRTGDIACRRADGAVLYMGRLDFQVKVRGFRVELGEIENRLLKHPDIKEAVVVTVEETGKEAALCAYIVCRRELAVAGLREHVMEELPAYMVPSYFFPVESIPLTSGGKADRKALKALGKPVGLKSAGPSAAPVGETEKRIAEALQELLGLDSVGVHDNFFDMGCNSLTMIRLNGRLRKFFPDEIPMVTFFNYPTVSSLAGFLSGEGQTVETGGLKTGIPGHDEHVGTGSFGELGSDAPAGKEIAVIGMAGRFPGAGSVSEFLENLKNGVESITALSAEELEQMGYGERKDDPAFVPCKGRLEERGDFDSFFFGYTPSEASKMDPQVRIFHESCWEAMESAGYIPGEYVGHVGLYAGASPNPYWEMSPLLGAKGDFAERWAAVQLSDKDYLATRVAYQLNLKGPCLAMQTACSTSLAALGTACRELLGGACDMALAGGVSVTLHDEAGYFYQEGAILSPDGHCRAFDAEAAGTVGGNGVGVVLLKPLESALRDRDPVLAVIKGFAVNNDGREKAGFTAPGITGQVDVISTALRMGNIEPETIGYIETHGTATRLGDPIEIESLRQAYKGSSQLTAPKGPSGFQGPRHAGWDEPPLGPRRVYPTPRGGAAGGNVALGSVKTNIGHLDAAAGIAGFIKAVLAVKHRVLFPSLHFKAPNPRINFSQTPFYVNNQLKEWKSEDHPLRAGVSSFGIGGTNAHIIVEEAPKVAVSEAAEEECLLVLSAKTDTALAGMTENLAEYFKRDTGTSFADAVYTLQTGRSVFSHRRAVVCTDKADAAEVLSRVDSDRITTFVADEKKRSVVFMFPGQGAQYRDMALGLYEKERVFKREMDRCFGILESFGEEDFKQLLYPSAGIEHKEMQQKAAAPGEEAKGKTLEQTEIAQPLIFSIEYALAKMLMHWGILPQAMIGHSIGEYAAACLAGVFSLEEALELVALRGRLMQRMPGGAMLSVPLSEDSLLPLLPAEGVSVAGINSPTNCVVSGSHEDIESFEGFLKSREIQCRKLHTSHAFHSFMMEPILQPFQEEAARVKRERPLIPYVSNVTGKWITAGDVTNPKYWADHIRQPVRFAAGLEELNTLDGAVFIEVGPGRVLSSLVRQYGAPGEYLTANLVRHPKEDTGDRRYLLNQLGQLWVYGVSVDWRLFYGEEQRRRVGLPTYPFERIQYPVDVDIKALTSASRENVFTRKADMADWFYTQVWEQSVRVEEGAASLEGLHWLIFTDETNMVLVESLAARAAGVSVVKMGEEFAFSGDTFFIDPTDAGHYDRLFKQLALADFPDRIVYLWSKTDEKMETGSDWGQAENTDWGQAGNKMETDSNWGQAEGLQMFYSLLEIARSVGDHAGDRQVHLDVVCNGMFEVTGGESLKPVTALMLGAVKVIPLEYPGVGCRCIDIPGLAAGGMGNDLVSRLLTEFSFMPTYPGNIVALRGGFRWVHVVKPLPIESTGQRPKGLKQKGVYLVTGGLGGIGLTLAGYLAESVQARLVLLGGSEFPRRDQWENILEAAENAALCTVINRLKGMETAGAEIQIFSADVADYGRMETVISGITRDYGRIDGLIHAAGRADTDGVIQGRSNETIRKVMAAKVEGTMVLDRLLPGLDFIVLCSSLSNAACGVSFGQVGYNAANEFLEAYARYKNAVDGVYTVSIGWPAWREVGMWAENADHAFAALESMGLSAYRPILENTVTPAEGCEIFKRILGSGLKNAMVSPADLPALMNLYNLPEAENTQAQAESAGAQKVQRPGLGNEYVEPVNDTQRTLVDIYEEFFGFAPIGITDNFFKLGGDSLKAVIVSSKIHKELDVKVPLKVFFSNPTIRDLAGFIGGESVAAVIYSSISSVREKAYYSLSSAQKRMYLLHQMEEKSARYNLPAVMTLEGTLDRDTFQRAVKQLVRRHESLRTSFELMDGEPVQRILPEVEFEVDFFEESGGAGGGMDYEKQIGDFIRPFDLTRAPLVRVGLIRVEKNKDILVFDMHHIIADGTSQNILKKDFMEIYSGNELPGLNVQYKDYCQWRRKLSVSAEMRKQEAYWLDVFKPGEAVPAINLPLDFKRPARQSFEGGKLRFNIGATESAKLKQVTLDNGATLYTMLLALFNIFLSKLGGMQDIVVGSPEAGRGHDDLQGIVGMFVNTLALRNFPAGDKTFPGFLKEVTGNFLEAAGNSDYQYEELVGKVVSRRDMSRNPLFDVLLVLQNQEDRALEISDLKLTPYEMDFQVSQFDLTLDIVEEATDLRCVFEYASGLFRGDTIERMAGYFCNIIAGIAADPGVRLWEIELITPEEKRRILEGFSDAVEVPHKTIHGLFKDQAQKIPQEPAVVFAGESLTYKELDEKSSSMAALLAAGGVEAGTVVALIEEPALDTIAVILGILKAGGIYLPIDLDFPRRRKRYMLADSAAEVLITGGEPASGDVEGGKTFGLNLRVLDRAGLSGVDGESRESFGISTPSAPGEAAYVIYTSGSTGEPKGVVVRHSSAVHLLISLKEAYGLDRRDVSLQKTTFTFDVSISELLRWIPGGGTLAMMRPGRESDPEAIIDTVARYAVTLMDFVPSMLDVFLEYLEMHGAASEESGRLSALRWVFVGAEVLSPALMKRFYSLCGEKEGLNALLVNAYGPTEATVDAAHFLCPAKGDMENVPIGRPLGNTRLYILDSRERLLPIGVPGELCISGPGPALGYLNRVGLTAETFVENPFEPGQKMYKTGDMARLLADGNIEFHGRADSQVKIKGFRIELGEIQNLLAGHESIKQCIVTAAQKASGQKYLCAYILSADPAYRLDVPGLKQFTADALPHYMVPDSFVLIRHIPLTANGKIDYAALPAADFSAGRRDAFVAPGSEVEERVSEAWKNVLELREVGIHDNFFEIGGNSLSIIRLNSLIKKQFKRSISIPDMFTYPTIHTFANYLTSRMQPGTLQAAPAPRGGVLAAGGNEIAVIGLAGRFPGASDVREFWANLCDGVESVTFMDREQLIGAGESEELIDHPAYVNAKGILERKEYFDASFFSYTPKESEMMDPQLRLLHECAWSALEDAGYEPGGCGGSIGLYAGASWSDYMLQQLLAGSNFTEQWQVSQYNDRDFLCTRVSYNLDLKGPSVTVQTACSTSLAAIDIACQGLAAGKCDMALAGGVSASSDKGHLFQEGMIMSSDGHCRAFDAAAEGIVAGNGVGLALLKPLEKALEDRDYIYAVIKGTGSNNDGRDKVGFTAPSVPGQSEAIRSALEVSGIHPDTIGYVEAHGTGTRLGDPIEVEALTLAFRALGSVNTNFCGLGSVKTNFGHLDAAAGITGFIKAVLAVNHRFIPPSLNYKTPNPVIDFENSPFYVNAGPRQWPEGPARAGVSSLGLGGTNVHVVLEEAPGKEAPGDSRNSQLLLLSARSSAALNGVTEKLKDYLAADTPDESGTPESTFPGIADVAYTLKTCRKHFPYRRAVTCSTIREAVKELSAASGFIKADDNMPVVFMFSGQGTQYHDMGLDLYHGEALFRENMDRGFEILNRLLGRDAKEILFPGTAGNETETIGNETDSAGIPDNSNLLDDVFYSGPVKFVFEYSLARLLMSWGITPRAMIGHSFGEYVVACLAGVFSLEEGLQMAVLRGSLMEKTASGAMLSVSLSREELAPLLHIHNTLSLAAVNSPDLCIVSGPPEAVDKLQNELEENDHQCIRINFPRAGHSQLMEPVLQEFRDELASIHFKQPQIPYLSGLTGTWITDRDAMDPAYWTGHLRHTALFSDGLSELLKEGSAVFIEVGPGRGLTLFLGQHLQKNTSPHVKHFPVNMVRHRKEDISDTRYTMQKLGELWQYGVAIDWQAFYAAEKRSRTPLPTYPFEGEYYFLDQNSSGLTPSHGVGAPTRGVGSPLHGVDSPPHGAGSPDIKNADMAD
ncbi:MAG: amino acid adenylation domain-containing protein, partial [bacterium]|nr:amino acid adenylation domain-containing protein [bacterium]